MEFQVPNGDISNNQMDHISTFSKQRGQGTVQSRYETMEFEAPHFTGQFESDLTVDEGEPIRLSGQVVPAGDNSLTIEWLKDGKPLLTGTRFSTIFDRGYVVLDILYSIEEDSGVYVCVATSKSGQDQSNQINVSVAPEAKVNNNCDFIESQQVQHVESEPHQPDKHESSQPPQFLKNLTSNTTVNQGESVHLETSVEPRNDVSLTVEWHKDGQSISLGSRFNAVFDRGFCVLDILYTYPEDDGIYTCIARNNCGEAQSSNAQITCMPDEKIISKSNLNESSISQLKRFESNIQEEICDTFRHMEDEEQDQAPVFDKRLQDVIIDEGCPAKFIININSHPRASIVWSINNEEVKSDSVNKFYNDGTINYLELTRCTEIGKHQIRVVATNSLGQIASECNLTVNSINNYAQDLKHIAPENPYKKMAALKRVDCTPELTTAFHKPRPTAERIVKIERNAEVKSRHSKTSDILETEKLYDQVASKLKSKGNISTGKRPVVHGESKMPPPPMSSKATWGNDSTENAFTIDLGDDMPPPPSH